MRLNGTTKPHDDWNQTKSDIGTLLAALIRAPRQVLGLGQPERRATYIYGKPSESIERPSSPQWARS